MIRPALLLLSCALSCASVGSAAAHEVFVSNERDNTVSVIDTATFEVTRTFPVGRRPRGLVFS
ncbi:hypothetical protein ACLBXP_25975, partial [Methylobacterium sp. A54F]